MERSHREKMFREDPGIAAIADDILTAEGIEIYYNTKIEGISGAGQTDSDQTIVAYQQNHENKQLSASRVLPATGRVPNSDRLNL